VIAKTTHLLLTDLFFSVLSEKILVRKPHAKRGVNKGTVLRSICTEIGCKSGKKLTCFSINSTGEFL
jgi:hypothetical protein